MVDKGYTGTCYSSDIEWDFGTPWVHFERKMHLGQFLHANEFFHLAELRHFGFSGHFWR